jgi:hypothetical protein
MAKSGNGSVSESNRWQKMKENHRRRRRKMKRRIGGIVMAPS